MPLSFTGPDSFFAADEEAWWTSVDKALKGAPREKLFGSTEDGLEIAPLYARRTDTPARSLRSAAGAWSIVQSIDIADPHAANAQILEDLQSGASGLDLVFSGSLSAHGHGIRLTDLAGLEVLLQDVQPDLIDIRIDSGPDCAQFHALMLALLERRGIDPALVATTSTFDPYGWMAVTGMSGADFDVLSDRMQELARAVRDAGSPARVMNADGRVWHDAGATPAQELALVLAAAVGHLRKLEEAGLPPEEWATRIAMCLVADADQFGTIAKARAIRALWSCVLEEAGLPQSPVALHMATSYRMLTARDPWVNMLRNTVAGFAAGIGGADSVCVLPHTLAVGLPDGFARRLARNTQSILLEESNLAKVKDPAAGSGALEDRTEKLCAAAWDLFQEIEAAGDLCEALRQGLVQKRIGAAKAERDSNVARRKRPITGVSEFPDLGEAGVSVLQEDRDAAPAVALNLDALPEPGDGRWFAALREQALAGGALIDPSADIARGTVEPSFPVLEVGRVSEPFEALRAAAAGFEAATGAAPTVFLASLGTLAQFAPRATWTANAFAAGGIRAEGPAVHASLEELVAAFSGSGASLACLVSSDDVYEAEGEAAARALKQAGAAHLYMAGRPGAREVAYAAAGVDTFLYAGCDLLELLKGAHARMKTMYDGGPSEQEVLK
ncbi:methylmalonyl-CoA mutase family protein [Labrenzia sp. 011]|uniref:methylmalonyl-CoA mutase family protein n=1 Tax=Labrenzia sp. 011 TaxID=2171494 RepID=UPI000D520E89|nr:methylmalonyl-CoA mutase family protein [Labrenzia sp. 011]PVB61040.1 methylmalonyl-CoA mutase [Labrenzia sp. 011]